MTLRYSLLRRDLLASNKGELVQEIDKLVINVEQGKMDLDTATNILIQYTETCTYRKARELLGGWKRRKLRAALDEYTETPGDGYPNKE